MIIRIIFAITIFIICYIIYLKYKEYPNSFWFLVSVAIIASILGSIFIPPNISLYSILNAQKLFKEPPSYMVVVGIALIISIFIILFVYILIVLFSKSIFNGLWKMRIYDENNLIIEENIVKIKYNKKTHWLHGKFNKTFQNKNNHAKFILAGLLLKYQIVCLIWSLDILQVNINCIFLHLTNDYLYEGYCVKCNEYNQIQKNKITLSKILQ